MLRKYAFMLLITATGHFSHAQVIFKSIDDVWQYADAHNITIRSAKYDVEKATYSKRQSYSTMLPQIAANGTYTNNIQLQVVLYCQPAKRAILAAEQSLLLAELLLQNAENDFTITRRMPLLERRDVVSAILTPPR